MTERCNDDVAFPWWKYDYDEDDDYDEKMIMMVMVIMIIMVMMIIIIVIVKKNIVHPYFRHNCEIVVVASFSCSVRLIFILPTS